MDSQVYINNNISGRTRLGVWHTNRTLPNSLESYSQKLSYIVKLDWHSSSDTRVIKMSSSLFFDGVLDRDAIEAVGKLGLGVALADSCIRVLK